MPKAPILARYGFTAQMPDKSVRLLEWNAVDTELGTMVEPRQVNSAGAAPFAAVDAIDAGFTSILPINSDVFYRQYGTDGNQLPMDITL